MPETFNSSLSNGDFLNVDYNNNSVNGQFSADRSSFDSLALLYNTKDDASFYWNIGKNPDLAFTSVGFYNHLPDSGS